MADYDQALAKRQRDTKLNVPPAAITCRSRSLRERDDSIGSNHIGHILLSEFQSKVRRRSNIG